MVQQIQNLVVEERKKTKHPLKTQIQSLGPGFQDPTEKRKQKQKKKTKKNKPKERKGERTTSLSNLRALETQEK